MRVLKKLLRRAKRSSRRVKRELLKIDGRTVEVTLKSDPRAHRFIVKVDPTTGEVSVISPSVRSFERALDFARKEREWIAGRLANVPAQIRLRPGETVMLKGVEHVIRAGEVCNRPVWIDRDAPRPTIRVAGRDEHVERRVVDWLKREAKRRIEDRVTEYALALGVSPKRITIRDTSSRWGSCSSTRSLSFSWRLILAPPRVLDYVVAHEVAHLRELNHEPRFWRLVETLVPDAEENQQWLAENGALLHRYAPRKRRGIAPP
jgi:predicted metal-dependent hydrolase